MTAIWPDGKVEEIADETAGVVKEFVDFCRWFESLPKERRDAIKHKYEAKEYLQQHGRRDRGA